MVVEAAPRLPAMNGDDALENCWGSQWEGVASVLAVAGPAHCTWGLSWFAARASYLASLVSYFLLSLANSINCGEVMCFWSSGHGVKLLWQLSLFCCLCVGISQWHSGRKAKESDYMLSLMMLDMYPGLQRSISVSFPCSLLLTFTLCSWWLGGGEVALYDGGLVLSYADKSQSSCCYPLSFIWALADLQNTDKGDWRWLAKAAK